METKELVKAIKDIYAKQAVEVNKELKAQGCTWGLMPFSTIKPLTDDGDNDGDDGGVGNDDPLHPDGGNNGGK